MPTSNASQLSPGTTRGAAANMATVNAILTNSQPRSPTIAAPAVERLRAMPRANSAAGTTTDRAPYPADHATGSLPVSHHASRATTAPTAAWPQTMRQTDSAGWRDRHSRASCAVRGLKSESSTSDSVSEAIFLSLEDACATDQNFHKALDYK